VSLRYFNVFGPRQNPESKYSAVIPRFLAQALAGEPLEVHGDGEQSRDFTYIDNVVEANLLAMKTAGVSGQVFNVACGTRHSLLAIADAIAAFLGRRLERAHVPPRAGDVCATRSPTSARRSGSSAPPRRRLRERHAADLRVLRRALQPRTGVTTTASAPGATRGSSTVIVVPEAGSLCTATQPPSASLKQRTM
jgi:nucleoside-diphosphate-sugar epimerase